MTARIGMIISNEGSTPTFRRTVCKGTIPDITMIKEKTAWRSENWRVIEDFTGSDHQYILFNVKDQKEFTQRRNWPKWNFDKTNKKLFLSTIAERKNSILKSKRDVETTITKALDLITHACDISMPRKKQGWNNQRPAYWWTEEISQIRRNCLRSRRRTTRMKIKNTDDAIKASAEYVLAKKDLRKAIRKSKHRC